VNGGAGFELFLFTVHGLRFTLFDMFDRFKQRSYELEHLDKGDYTAEEYEGCIVELQLVNRWLGDARALRRTLLREIERTRLRSFSVLDVGAGSGELLRVIAAWARAGSRNARLCGVELNARSAQAIIEQSREFPEITGIRGDAFYLPFADAAFDYAICSLFTHHFTDDQVVPVLRELERVARRRIFVIDLHRHPVAYFFYTTVGRLFLHNRLLREDGALSILRSFKPNELAKLGEIADLKNVDVHRHFPYRLVLTASPAHGAQSGRVSERQELVGKTEAAA
jgi:SAM-dependent methyltransferase